MALVDTLLLEPAKADHWIALRADQIRGSGSASDPYHGGLSAGPEIPVSLTRNTNEALADTGSLAHGFFEGDVVQIRGVTGSGAAEWNRAFAIYDVTQTSFRFAFGVLPELPQGSPRAALVTFLFDKILRDLPPYTRVNIGPSPRDALKKPIPFQTRGFAPRGVGGWLPKSGQKIVGAGMDATVLQLVGAGLVKVNEELVEQHYHAVGMPLAPTGQTAIAPLQHFEISDLTIDCNLDGQPLRGQSTYTPVACGAIRIIGNQCRVRDVKAINWGTKSLKHGCFVISLIGASGRPEDPDGNPIITEKDHCGIEDCIAIDPSRFSARETRALRGDDKGVSTRAGSILECGDLSPLSCRATGRPMRRDKSRRAKAARTRRTPRTNPPQSERGRQSKTRL